MEAQFTHYSGQPAAVKRSAIRGTYAASFCCPFNRHRHPVRQVWGNCRRRHSFFATTIIAQANTAVLSLFRCDTRTVPLRDNDAGDVTPAGPHRAEKLVHECNAS
jgi:hypothetical protein